MGIYSDLTLSTQLAPADANVFIFIAMFHWFVHIYWVKLGQQEHALCRKKFKVSSSIPKAILHYLFGRNTCWNKRLTCRLLHCATQVTKFLEVQFFFLIIKANFNMEPCLKQFCIFQTVLLNITSCLFFQKVNTGFIENEIEKLNGESLLSLKVSEKWIDSFLLSYDFIVESIIIFIMFNIRF